MAIGYGKRVGESARVSGKGRAGPFSDVLRADKEQMAAASQQNRRFRPPSAAPCVEQGCAACTGKQAASCAPPLAGGFTRATLFFLGQAPSPAPFVSAARKASSGCDSITRPRSSGRSTSSLSISRIIRKQAERLDRDGFRQVGGLPRHDAGAGCGASRNSVAFREGFDFGIDGRRSATG